MVSGSEFEALRIVAEDSGETVAGVVSRRMRISTEYARLLLNSLARADYLDQLASGRYRITIKGKKALERKGMRADKEQVHTISKKFSHISSLLVVFVKGLGSWKTGA